MSKLGKFSENHENHENVQQHEMDFVVFHEFYETFDFLIQVIPSPQWWGGGGGVFMHGFKAEYPPPAPHRERHFYDFYLIISMNCTFNSPQPPMPSELLKILVISGFKVA